MRIASCLLTLFFLGSSVRGDIITGDLVLQPFAPTYQFLSLSKSIPPVQGRFRFSITPLGSGVFRLDADSIAEGVAMFNATNNMPFTVNYVANNSPLITNMVSGPQTATLTFAMNESKYLAYWDSRDIYNANPVPRDLDLYGWGELRWDGGEYPVIVDSATATNTGIFVGTYQQIPEPTSFVLITFLVLASACSRFRRREQW